MKTQTEKFRAHLDQVIIAAQYLRSSWLTGLDFESEEYRDFLDAVYNVTEIDAVWDAAREVGPVAGIDPFALTTAERRAERFADAVIDMVIGK